ASGRALTRFPHPLRWEMLPPQNEQGDYRFRLVQSDGGPAPEVLCVLPGHPTLYLTVQGVFSGPDALEEILDPAGENPIPAAALESTAGIGFLDLVGVELPPALQGRVQKLAWKIQITCALRAIYPGSDVEECVLEVVAEAPDGRKQSWTGFNWVEKKATTPRKTNKADAIIVVYDAAPLAEVPRLLEPLHLKPSQYGSQLSIRLTKRFAENFVAWLGTVPPHVTVKLEGELASLLNGDVAGRVKLEVTEQEIDWFDLRVVLDIGDTTLSPEEIKLLLNAKGGYVRLRGKGWRRLQYDLGGEENDKLARLGLSPRELSAEPQRFHALQLADDAAKNFLPIQQVEQIQRRATEIKARVAPDLPPGISAELRPYQLEGFHFLAYLAVNRFGGILADDMGLGKTLQTLAWLVWLREQELATMQRAPGPAGMTSLVVCPKSVMDNWQAEAARFAPGLRVKVWAPSQLPELCDDLGAADLHVLNYSQLRSLGESLVSVQWLALVLDEGQYIKNPGSQTAQIARSLRAAFRLVLSGTPIENRLLDLWSLMAFTMPGLLGSRAQFARLYDVKGDPLARRRLAARVRPFLLRRTKGQVARDLPDRIEEDLFCEIEGEQKSLYRAEIKAAQQLLLRIKTQKELAQQQFHFLTSLLRLRQICCHPRLLQPDSTAPSAKTESLLEQLEPLMEEGQKVLVFSQFVQMLELLRPEIEKRKWPSFYLVGQTENRGELVRRFQAAEGPAVFLISLKAGGFGLNLTAASYVIVFDPWWNPAVENQAIDRTHRIGQTNKVIAYRLLIKNSIEEKIRELQRQKKSLAEDVLGEEKFAQSLTLDDLRFLLSD
ncbi:MAG TPA: SNF2-related protein, partial [Patescibacteria group bacterium]|nr:SNF2-related protein [Patescibacteria group bacterium]